MLQAPPSLESLTQKAADGLFDNFKSKATITAASPGRVNLIGEHIDYCDGYVLPFAIDRYIVIAGTPNGGSSVRIATALGGGIATFDVSQPVEEGEPKWTNYLRGVIRGFQNLGHTLRIGKSQQHCQKASRRISCKNRPQGRNFRLAPIIGGS